MVFKYVEIGHKMIRLRGGRKRKERELGYFQEWDPSQNKTKERLMDAELRRQDRKHSWDGKTILLNG